MKRKSTNRRQFMTRAAAGTAALASGTGPLTRPAAGQSSSAPGDDRIQKEFDFKMRAADYWKTMGEQPHPVNGDEDRYSNKINSFSKSLLHDPLGIVSRDAYASMQRAVRSGRDEDFDAVIRGGNVRLKNPSGAYNLQTTGADGSQYSMRAAPAFDSAEQAGEMVELYWQALTRDVPFANFGSDPVIAQACDELSRLSDFRGPKAGGRVTPASVFRGNTAGDLAGPYVSQFLVLPFEMGSVFVEQKQKPAVAGLDYMTTYSEWLGIQFGEGKGPGNRYEDTHRYIRNGRDLTTFVHLDQSFSPYYPAVWLLLGWGPLAYSADNPYVWSRGQEGFVNFGPIDAFEYLSRAVKPAFNAAWYQKWFVHHRARPEVFGARIFNHIAKLAVYPIHQEVLGARALEEAFRKFGTHLLTQAYSEGSPPHSSYPSGHATCAGAVVTMLKAFFREDFVIPNPVVPSADGTRLLPYSGPALTVGGELNKAAFNVAMGRDWAGIHWRTDASEGLKLGEEAAINVLRDLTATYMDRFGGFSFTRFNGERVTICGYC